MSVGELVGKYEVDPQRDLIVVYDELDFPFGALRIKKRGSSAGHNGMESVIGALGTDDFVRVRLGIAPQHAVRDGARYVLSPFKKAQLPAVSDLLDRAAEAVMAIVTGGVDKAMNRFNQRAEAEADKD